MNTAFIFISRGLLFQDKLFYHKIITKSKLPSTPIQVTQSTP